MPSLPAPGFTPNFTSTYSVLINHPIDVVHRTIATSESCERVTRASSLCTGFQLLERDTIPVPNSLVLTESSLRNLTPFEGEPGEGARLLPRQHYTFRETIVDFGLIKMNVNVRASIVWDDQAKTGLYESATGSIMIWKSRKFEEEEDGTKTRLIEHLKGTCPAWMQFFVSSIAAKAHIKHLDTLVTLFEEN